MRRLVLDELEHLFPLYPKFQMNGALIEELRHPPQSPEECIFARTTLSLSADLETRIGPCQFGGKPDCSQCGCVASMALAAVGHHQVLPGLTAGDLMFASEHVGAKVARVRSLFRGKQHDLPPAAPPLTQDKPIKPLRLHRQVHQKDSSRENQKAESVKSCHIVSAFVASLPVAAHGETPWCTRPTISVFTMLRFCFTKTGNPSVPFAPGYINTRGISLLRVVRSHPQLMV